MRKFLLILLTAFCLVGCHVNHKQAPADENGYPKTLFVNGKWEIVQINDTVVILTPGLNTEGTPIPVNLKNITSNMAE